MELKPLKIEPYPTLNVDLLAAFIADLQFESGEIPWHEGGKTDPWDLVESIMGLNIGGLLEASERAFEWMIENQNENGSWFSSYINGVPQDRTMESNMSSYIAVGVFHTWLIRRDTAFLDKMWPCVKKGIEYALTLQTERGEVYWAKSPEGNVDPMALLTGCSSIFMSLKCALSIAHILKLSMPEWEDAFLRLGSTIRDNIHIYNISKSRFSMYWFYPMLSGALTGYAAERRIEKYWKKYVVDEQGVRCVSDRPWITMAETSEFVLALDAMGNSELAKIIFSWIQSRVYEDGTFWCGYTFPDMVVWPEDKISWTNGVALMAGDALYGLTPASGLFRHESWDGFLFKDI